MQESIYVIKPSGYDGSCYTMLQGDCCPYSKKTRAEFIAEGYKVLTLDELTPITNNFLDSLCDNWKEITSDDYDYALNVLPPAKWSNGGFYVPEAYTHNVYSFYQKWQGKYYTSLQRINTPRERILMTLETFAHNVQ